MIRNIIILLLLNILTYSQWQPDVRLTNNPFSSNLCDNNAKAIASSGNLLHLVWSVGRDSNYEIYYKRSTDVGLSWSTDTRLTNNSASSARPTITVSDSIVHVIWQDNRDGNNEIYYKRSTDAGISWGSDIRLTNNSALSLSPSIVAIGQFIHVVWFDERDGNFELYYKRSSNAGIDWGNDVRLTNDPATSWNPSITALGLNIHIVWDDDRGSAPYELYYKRSTDEGLSWGTDIPLTNNTPGGSNNPSISISGSIVHVAWEDYRNGDEIYYKRSTDEGLNWGTDMPLTNSSGISGYPSISASGSLVHVAWWDDRDGDREIYYKRSTNGGIIWESDTRLTISNGVSQNVSIAVSEYAIHTIWQDHRDGNSEIYYKRNPTGNVVVIEKNNSEIPKQYYLSQNYPNPFNPTTQIEFSIPQNNVFVNLTVFDVTGREISTLVNKQLNAGTHKVDFNGENLSSGVFFYKLNVNDASAPSSISFIETKKMILIK